MKRHFFIAQNTHQHTFDYRFPLKFSTVIAANYSKIAAAAKWQFYSSCYVTLLQLSWSIAPAIL